MGGRGGRGPEVRFQEVVRAGFILAIDVAERTFHQHRGDMADIGLGSDGYVFCKTAFTEFAA